LSAGDVLDQAIRIYRQNFIPLVGIVAIATVPVMVLGIISSILIFQAPFDLDAPESNLPALFSGIGLLLGSAAFIVQAFVAILQAAALAIFVSERYMGRPMTIGSAYAGALRRWLALLIAFVLIGLASAAVVAVLFVPLFGAAALATALGSASDAALGLAVLLICLLGLPLVAVLVFLNVRWIFTTQAIVLEGYNSTGGMGRSWRLTRGTFWRVLGFSIILILIVQLFALGPVALFQMGTLLLPSPQAWLIVNQVAQSTVIALLAPIQYAVWTILYYDLRVRKEGLDIALGI
jgi:hypothetical protein